MSQAYQLPNPYLEALLMQRSKDSHNQERFAAILDRALELFEAGAWQSSRADQARRRLMQLRDRMRVISSHVMEAYDQTIRCQPETVGLDDPRAYWRARF